jgi:type I restriction enzyme R subunit
MANPLDNFELSMKPVIDGLVMDRMDRNQDIATAYFNETEFATRFFKAVVRRVYDEIRKPESQAPSSR